MSFTLAGKEPDIRLVYLPKWQQNHTPRRNQGKKKKAKKIGRITHQVGRFILLRGLWSQTWASEELFIEQNITG